MWTAIRTLETNVHSLSVIHSCHIFPRRLSAMSPILTTASLLMTSTLSPQHFPTILLTPAGSIRVWAVVPAVVVPSTLTLASQWQNSLCKTLPAAPLWPLTPTGHSQAATEGHNRTLFVMSQALAPTRAPEAFGSSTYHGNIIVTVLTTQLNRYLLFYRVMVEGEVLITTPLYGSISMAPTTVTVPLVPTEVRSQVGGTHNLPSL